MDHARQLLDELSHSILIRAGARISFQMRSYGEYLAAEELHDKDLDRLKVLAFHKGVPIDTWLNTITYLAEMNANVRGYFVRHHPEWLIGVSVEAFSEDERTELTGEVIRWINGVPAYLANESLPLRRLSRLLTPPVISVLEGQLSSPQAHERANALVLLALQKNPSVVPLAIQLVTEHRNASPLRYSAMKDDQLQAGEVSFPNNSPLDWIAKVKSEFAIDELRALRIRGLQFRLWRVSSLLTSTIGNIDRFRAAAMIRQQMAQTPQDWQDDFRQEAEKLERTGRIEQAQRTPFDEVIRKLKGSSSMILVKVWCEGSTDRPIFRTLFSAVGEADIARTLDFVGGWSNLLSEHDGALARWVPSNFHYHGW